MHGRAPNSTGPETGADPQATDAPALEELRAELETARAQLVEAQRLAALGEAAAMAIHEFNNTFTALQNYARMAEAGDEAAREKVVRLAREGAPRAVAVCRAQLDLARAEAPGPRTVPVAALVEQAVTALGRDLGRDNITLSCEVSGDLTVRTRPAEAKQVLLNLLLNAREAVLARGGRRRIRITAGRDNGEVFLSVHDSGGGIPREIRGRIFEPFFTTRGESGSGLGLAVSRRIAESLDGRLTVRSQVGRGSCFTVALPAGEPAAAPHGAFA